MRDQTDVFHEHEEIQNSDYLLSEVTIGELIGYEVCENGRSSTVILSKEKAIRHARQILEMCGEGQ